MKKKLFSTILTLSLITGLASASVFAESRSNDIRSVGQLKAELSGNLTKTEQVQIVERADEAVVDEFLMEKLAEAVTVLNDQEAYADMKALPDGSAYDVQTYDLGDGCILTVELRDAEEGAIVNIPGVSPMTTTQPDQWKDYGNRYFTAKASATIGNVSATMRLEHHYTLSADGIEAKKGVADVSWPKTGGSYSKSTPRISDRYARTVGASDVNIDCTYSFKWLTSDKKKQEAQYKIDTAVGYVDINKTAKKIKVRYSWNLTKV